jgi:Tfp pilus assembly protein PilN
MRAVNLLPKDEARRAPSKLQTVTVGVGTGGAVVVTALLAMMFLGASAKVKDEKATLKDIQGQLALVPPLPAAPTANETALRTQQTQRVAAVTAAMQRRVSWDRIMREVAQVLPEDVWLQSLTAKSPVSPSATSVVPPAPGAAPTSFSMIGYTYSHAAVARLLSRLQVVPDLTNVQLQRSNLTKVGTQQVVEFTIAADIRGPGAAS